MQQAGFIDLGVLKGNIGDQNYMLGGDVDLRKYRAVSIWCKRFSVNFGAAALKPTCDHRNNLEESAIRFRCAVLDPGSGFLKQKICPNSVAIVSLCIKGSEVRKADHPIETFLLDRWSPRADVGAEISEAELMRLFEVCARWAFVIQRSAMARPMRVAARNIGRRSSICSSMRTRRGQECSCSGACSFHEKVFDHNDEPSHALRRWSGVGELSRCKRFHSGLVVHGRKASITERARGCGSLTNSKSKRWPLSENPARKNYFLKNYKPAKV